MFFHQCVNTAWGTKGTEGPPISILGAFCKQGVLMALQWVQMVFTLRRAIAMGSSRLGVLSKGPPLSLFDMMFVTRRGLGI